MWHNLLPIRPTSLVVSKSTTHQYRNCPSIWYRAHEQTTVLIASGILECRQAGVGQAALMRQIGKGLDRTGPPHPVYSDLWQPNPSENGAAASEKAEESPSGRRWMLL